MKLLSHDLAEQLIVMIKEPRKSKGDNIITYIVIRPFLLHLSLRIVSHTLDFDLNLLAGKVISIKKYLMRNRAVRARVKLFTFITFTYAYRIIVIVMA